VKPRRAPVALTLVLLALGPSLLAAGCAVVPQNRRKHLADPMMDLETDTLLAGARRKLHTSREAAAGGDSAPAGGGCGCQ